MLILLFLTLLLLIHFVSSQLFSDISLATIFFDIDTSSGVQLHSVPWFFAFSSHIFTQPLARKHPQKTKKRGSTVILLLLLLLLYPPAEVFVAEEESFVVCCLLLKIVFLPLHAWTSSITFFLYFSACINLLPSASLGIFCLNIVKS